MPWFKVDDNLAFHHKTVAAGNAAMGLWVRAGSFCAQQLTDGFVPDHMVATLGTAAQADRLVQSRLWVRVEGGYSFHEWNEQGRQPTREQVEAEREAARERMAARRKGSGNVRANTGRSSDDVTAGVQAPRPDPTRPEGSKEPSGAKRATQRPADFRPNDKHIALAAENRIDLRAEWPQFCDHHDAKGSKFTDWNKALNTWIRNAAKFGGNVRQLPNRPPEPDADGQIILPPLPGNEWSGR